MLSYNLLKTIVKKQGIVIFVRLHNLHQSISIGIVELKKNKSHDGEGHQ